MSNKINGYERGEQTLEFLNVYCVSAFGQVQFLDLRGKPYPKKVLAWEEHEWVGSQVHPF
jgi:hypothetical protein